MMSSTSAATINAVDDERRVGVSPDEAEQRRRSPLSRSRPRRKYADDEQAFPPRRQVPEEDVGSALEENGAQRDRNEQEEGHPRSRVTVEAHEAGGRDRDPRPRDAGCKAAACAVPIMTASRILSESMCRRVGRWSAIQRTTANTARRIAICQGSPRCSAMNVSPAPMITAGIVATNRNQAIRSSAPATERREKRNQAVMYRARSRQKYATTATRVPRWRATSKVWLNSSFCSR